MAGKLALCALILLPSAWADDAAALCELSLVQSRVAIEEREIDVELAQTRLTAAKEIFSLVDQLWEKEAIARVPWLAGRHGHEVAVVDLERAQLWLKREQAERDYFAAICESKDAKRRADARARYDQADCHRIGKELAIAELDLAYHTELLDSAHDLRQGEVATAQDVIIAERNVALARQRVDHHAPRVEACK